MNNIKSEPPQEALNICNILLCVWAYFFFPLIAPASILNQHLLPSHDPDRCVRIEQIVSPHLAWHLSIMLWTELDTQLTKHGPHICQEALCSTRVSLLFRVLQKFRLLGFYLIVHFKTNGSLQITGGAIQLKICASPYKCTSACLISESTKEAQQSCAHP